MKPTKTEAPILKEMEALERQLQSKQAESIAEIAAVQQKIREAHGIVSPFRELLRQRETLLHRLERSALQLREIEAMEMESDRRFATDSIGSNTVSGTNIVTALTDMSSATLAFEHAQRMIARWQGCRRGELSALEGAIAAYAKEHDLNDLLPVELAKLFSTAVHSSGSRAG